MSLNQELPSNSCLAQSLDALFVGGVHVALGDCVVSLTVINNILDLQYREAIIADLVEYVFRYNICCILPHVAVLELHFIGHGVDDVVVVVGSDDSSFGGCGPVNNYYRLVLAVLG